TSNMETDGRLVELYGDHGQGRPHRGWFAARPSGTENVYKIYAESFKDQGHLDALVRGAGRWWTGRWARWARGARSRPRRVFPRRHGPHSLPQLHPGPSRYNPQAPQPRWRPGLA